MAFNIFENEDQTFPRSQFKKVGVVESTSPDDEPGGENAISVFSVQNARNLAMNAVLGWADDKEYNYLALDEYVCGMADIDGDFELSDDEDEHYNDIWAQIPNALLSLGAEEDDVQKFVNGEDDAAAARLGKALAKSLAETDADDDELIAAFAFGEDSVLESVADDEERHMILEASYRKKKVIRDGKMQVVRKRVSGKVRLSAAQRAGLRKARRKAHTGAAKLARRKSMRKRKQRGL